MPNQTITFTVENQNGAEFSHELPAKFDVCPGCDGHGTHLTPSIRDHAYTSEEFDEAFSDEDERADYFRRGGRYDVQCQTCRGARVVSVPDRAEAKRTLRGRRLLAIYDRVQRQRARWAAEEAHERRMGY